MRCYSERECLVAYKGSNPLRKPDPEPDLPPGVYDVVAEAEAAYKERGLKSVREFACLFSIERAAKVLQAQAKDDLDSHRLTYAGWLALTVLSYAKFKALPTAKLAARVGSHPTTLTNTVDNLERLGFVRRRSKDGDRRVVILELTAEGDAVQAAINERRAEERFGLGALEAAEVDELIRLLRKVRLSLGDLWQHERSKT
jgi:DNA-binding MarR family transcriptional regulator